MTCRYCNQEIVEVVQHMGPEIFVHSKTNDRHCNRDWEITGGNVATPKEVTAK